MRCVRFTSNQIPFFELSKKIATRCAAHLTFVSITYRNALTTPKTIRLSSLKFISGRRFVFKTVHAIQYLAEESSQLGRVALTALSAISVDSCSRGSRISRRVETGLSPRGEWKTADTREWALISWQAESSMSCWPLEQQNRCRCYHKHNYAVKWAYRKTMTRGYKVMPPD